MICGSTTRIATCQVEAPSVCALTICSAGQRADGKRQVADQERRDAEHDQHHLRQLAQAEDDEQDRQDRHRRDHREHGDQRRERRAHQRQDADREPEGEARSSVAIPSPSTSRCRLAAVSAQSTISPDRRSGCEGDAAHRVRHLADRRQQLVVGIDGAPLRRADHIDRARSARTAGAPAATGRRGPARCS